MTAKRFTIDFDNRRIIDNKKNEYLVFLAQFKEVLNQLNDENEQLQKQIRVYEYFLEQNDLDIDWNCLCTADECYIQEDIDFDCKDCKYMELIE